MTLPFATPVLHTDRLILRAPELQDFPAYAAFMAGPRAAFVGSPMTREVAWRYFGHHVGHWALRGFGGFFMVPKAGGEVIGVILAWQPEGYPEREVGWNIFTDAAAGQGLATEGTKAVLRHVFSVWGWDTAVSYIDPANEASLRMAKRLGATHDPDAVQSDPTEPDSIWRHKREDWLC